MTTLIKPLLGMLVLCVLIPSFPQESEEKDSLWLIVPGKRFGPITADSTEVDLVKHFGRENVTTGNIFVGDGEEETGTVLFPNDPLRRVDIQWKDTEKKRFPFRIRIYGEKSRWHTREGISLGTTLAELERLNGKPFQLAGFWWDDGGAVTSWEGGSLEEAFEGKGKWDLAVFLSPPDWENTGLSVDEEQAVTGEGSHPSNYPVMRKMNLRVSELLLSFYEK